MSSTAAAAAHPEADQEFIEQVLALLRANGGRATPARRLLLHVLINSKEHRTAEQLAAEVQEQAPDVHVTTIYRNLDELERLRVISRTHAGAGPATYHLAAAAHGHLACESCGSITEISDEAFRELAEVAMKVHGFSINPGHFAVSGRCANCR